MQSFHAVMACSKYIQEQIGPRKEGGRNTVMLPMMEYLDTLAGELSNCLRYCWIGRLIVMACA